MRILLVFDRTQFSENGRFETRTNHKSAVQSHFSHISAHPDRPGVYSNAPLSVAELGKWVKIFGGKSWRRLLISLYTSRASLEAMGFRVRRLPVGFLLAIFRVPLVMRGPGQDNQLTPAHFCVDFFLIARRRAAQNH